LGDDVRDVELVAGFTVCVSAVDVLVVKFPSLAYTAVRLWLLALNAVVDVVNVATPETFNVPVPSGVAPSLKVTVPVGVPPVEVTVAVSVTAPP